MLRSKHSLPILFCLCAIIVMYVTATGQSCLDELAKKVKTNTMLTVFKSRQFVTKGRFLSVNVGEQSLSLLVAGPTGEAESRLEIGEIEKIQYKGRGKLNPIIIGAAVLLGAVVGGLTAPEEMFTPEDELRGAGIGAVVGGIVGSIISLSIKNTFTIECTWNKFNTRSL